MATDRGSVGIDQQQPARRALAAVSLAVWLCTAIWFSGTAAALTLSVEWDLSGSEAAWLTIAVQFGFIAGTLIYAILNLADRFNARHVFFFSALAGAVFNLAFAGASSGLASALLFRFLTGLTLAGIYPVGMKLVACWFQGGLGQQLGILIGALTLGKATAYLMLSLSSWVSWRVMAGSASLTSLAGGLIILLFLEDGPFLRARAPFDAGLFLRVFRDIPFRYTAFGYFGHMWELYAFWSLIGYYLQERLIREGLQEWVSLLTFAALAAGVAGCVLGGVVSRSLGERKVALFSMIISGSICLASGLAFELPLLLLGGLVLAWGFFVISDSAQFSALAARFCPPQYTGTALTVQNGVGFGITILSIQLLPILAADWGWQWAFLSLAPGPLIGSWFMMRLRKYTP